MDLVQRPSGEYYVVARAEIDHQLEGIARHGYVAYVAVKQLGAHVGFADGPFGHGEEFLFALANLALAHARAGDADRANGVCDELSARAAHEDVPAFHMATAYAAVGRMDKAFTVLDKGCDDRDPTLFPLRSLEPDLFWDDPRFAMICTRVGIEPFGR